MLEHVKTKLYYFKLYRRGIINKQMNNFFKNKCNTVIRQAKRVYFHDYFAKYKHDMKRYWAGIKDIIGQGSKGSNCIGSVIKDCVEVRDKYEIATAFNEHFATIAHKLERELPPPDDESPASIVPARPNSFYMCPVTPEECERIIIGLKNSSYGRDDISSRLLKYICKYVSIPLSKLINESFQVGIYPDELKVASITPIFKKGDKTLVSNYRPISVLPLLGKIFEKSMSNRITKYLNRFDIINKCQFGFQKGKSTCDAVTSLTDTIYENLNSGEHSVAIFIDRKAYDTVDHSILLLKLYQYGFRGQTHS